MGYINSHMSLSRSRCLSLFNFLRACVSMSDYIKLCNSTIFYIKMASCKSWLKKKLRIMSQSSLNFIFMNDNGDGE